MNRFFAFLLICLLPLHVFAKVVHIDSSAQNTPSMSMSLSDTLAIEQDSTDIPALFYGDHDTPHGTDTSDLSHISALDEPAIYSSLEFMPDALISFTVGKSDRAIQPPFLSPDGRPPRV